MPLWPRTPRAPPRSPDSCGAQPHLPQGKRLLQAPKHPRSVSPVTGTFCSCTSPHIASSNKFALPEQPAFAPQGAVLGPGTAWLHGSWLHIAASCCMAEGKVGQVRWRPAEVARPGAGALAALMGGAF